MSDSISAVVVIVPYDGRFAAIRSKKHNGKIGFPGGKVNSGEYQFDAAKRETYEETRLIISNLIILGRRFDGNMNCTLFCAENFNGTLQSSEEGEVFWATREELTSPETSAFPEWNTWAFDLFDDYISGLNSEIRIDEAGYQKILDMIENPPAPSPTLIAAVKRNK